jgi:hypothetical protein
MGKIKLYIVVAGCALVAGLFVLFVPKARYNDFVGAFSSSEYEVEQPPVSKTSFDEQLLKVVGIKSNAQKQTKKKKKTVNPAPYIPGQVKEQPPTVFNEIMVKTALSFAYKVGSCSKKTCSQVIDPSTEQWRIYAKVVTESKNACARRQLDACVIQSDILTAERRYIDAVEVAKSGFETAQSASSRCDNAKDPSSAKCADARAKMNLFSDRIKDLNKVLMQAH